MALSVGSSWTDLLSASPCRPRHHHKDIQLGRWRNMGCNGYQANWCIDTKRSPKELANDVPSLRSVFLKKRLSSLSYASSDNLTSDAELDSNAVDEENLETVIEDDSAGDNPCISTERAEGRPGFVSFNGNIFQALLEDPAPALDQKSPNLLWFIGPTVLVASFVIPSLYMRKLVLIVFEDSLLTDFLILFFTEALFYGGVAVFVLLIDRVWRPFRLSIAKKSYHPKYQFGLRISAVATLVLSLVIPLVTMGIVWPWTGPAASATLAPYLVGLVVQFAFEQYARHRKSTAWPVIPVIFQVYRLHQLNRAAQLVIALSFSVRGAETTSQTLAINSSLGTLLNVLQLLGIICVWSLASFLMRFLPGPTTSDP